MKRWFSLGLSTVLVQIRFLSAVLAQPCPAPASMASQQNTQSVLNSFKKARPNLAIRNETEISIGDSPGHAISYSLSSSGVEYDVVKAWTVKGDKAFIFTYNAPSHKYDEFAGDAEKIIGSLK